MHSFSCVDQRQSVNPPSLLVAFKQLLQSLYCSQRSPQTATVPLATSASPNWIAEHFHCSPTTILQAQFGNCEHDQQSLAAQTADGQLSTTATEFTSFSQYLSGLHSSPAAIQRSRLQPSHHLHAPGDSGCKGHRAEHAAHVSNAEQFLRDIQSPSHFAP